MDGSCCTLSKKGERVMHCDGNKLPLFENSALLLHPFLWNSNAKVDLLGTN